MIGVAGKDVLLDDLTDSEGILSYEIVMESLLKRSVEVKNSQVIKPCELQVHLLYYICVNLILQQI